MKCRCSTWRNRYLPSSAPVRIVLLAEIYNTAVPMVWTVANQFVDEKQDKRKYQFLIALLCAIIFMGGQLPFGMLVNLIYRSWATSAHCSSWWSSCS